MTPIEILLIVFGVLFYLAIGSFTCVIIDRLPLALEEPNRFGDLWDTRPWSEVMGGTSRCSSCGEPVRPCDNIPILSWLLLRGRCRGCGDRIPGFHPIVEFASPVLFLIAVLAMDHNWLMAPLLWLIPVGLAITAIDLRTLIVPTRIVWPALMVSVVLTVVASGLEGRWTVLLSALMGLVALGGPLFVLWFMLPNGMGFGDVRLATFLGWTVGVYAAGDMLHGLFLGVLALGAAAVIGLAYGVIAMGARGRKAKIPFGPALITATYLCCIFAPRILEPLS